MSQTTTRVRTDRGGEPERRAAFQAWRVVREDEGAVVLLAPSGGEPGEAGWAASLLAELRAQHRAGVVGAKRLRRDGAIASMGELIVHPKGAHALGAGLPGGAMRFVEEVDAVVGGAMAVRAEVLERVGGVGELRSAMDALTMCAQARLDGWRVLTTPAVSCVDETVLSATAAESAAFLERFGFDWRCADLDEVKRRHVGTGLVWNARWFGQPLGFAKYDDRPSMHWTSYAEVEPYRQRAHALVSVVERSAAAGGRVLDVGCGDGLFSHLLAKVGFEVTGVDPESAGVEQANARTSAETYPAERPRFVCGGVGTMQDGARGFDAAVLFDVIEHLPNPVAVLRAVCARLRPGGVLIVSTPEAQFGGSSDPVYHVTEYTEDELIKQLECATGGRVVNTGRITGVYRDLVVVVGVG